MNYKNNLSRLGFGCMRLPDSLEKSEKLILKAVEGGVNYFDTAYIYPGKEALLGNILHKNNLRDKAYIATKLPLFLCRGNADLDRIFNKQLSRLKTDYIDYYLLHMLSTPDELNALMSMSLDEWVRDKKQSGKIKQFGFSFHGKGDNFVKLIDAYDWDFCMIQYNYLDINNQAGLNGLKYAHSKNIPVIIMEPLRGGLLADSAQIPPKALDMFNNTSTPSLTPAQWALRWVLNHEEVTCVLSGMKTDSNLQDNLEVENMTQAGCMSADELGVIEQATAAFKETDVIPCTGCNYCMPCPAGVNIPGCFAAYNSYCGNKKSYNQYLLNTNAFISKKGTASGCVKCGKCETRCPQSIPIQDSLKLISRKMEPLWFKLSMPIVRRFMKKKKNIK